jgi:hypothetical protein
MLFFAKLTVPNSCLAIGFDLDSILSRYDLFPTQVLDSSVKLIRSSDGTLLMTPGWR